MRRSFLSFSSARTGSAAVEFALIGPLFFFLLVGLVVYGGWFWMAQGVQNLAAEGARAAIAGLDPDERIRLARGSVSDNLEGDALLSADAVQVAVQTDAGAIRVVVTYDASTHPLMALAGLVPTPPRTIERQAVVRTGGY